METVLLLNPSGSFPAGEVVSDIQKVIGALFMGPADVVNAALSPQAKSLINQLFPNGTPPIPMAMLPSKFKFDALNNPTERIQQSTSPIADNETRLIRKSTRT